MHQKRTKYCLKTAGIRIYICFLIGTVTLNSCDENKNNDVEKIVSYPVSIGNEWKYNQRMILNIYESETSDKIIEKDTFNFYLTVKIEKDTVLNDTMSVKQFTSHRNGDNWKSISYCFQDSEGLKTYAYSNAGGNDFPKKTAKRNVPIDLFSFNIFGPVISKDDELIFYYSPPALNIKFPLLSDSKWTYKYPAESFYLQIDKEVSGYENIKINNRSYSCYIVSWNYLYNENFTGYKITDWISKEGLIKRQTSTDRLILTDFEGDSINTCQINETILLDELNLY